MSTYIEPQVRVYREVEPTPSGTLPDLLTCIIGPKYRLVRYNVASERENGYLGAYDKFEASNDYSIPLLAGEVRDPNWGDVRIKDAFLRVFKDDLGEGNTITASYHKNLNIYNGSAKIKNAIYSANISWKANGTSYPRYAGLYNRDVQLGDTVMIRANISGDIQTVTSKVTGFLAEKVANIVHAAEAADTNVEGSGSSSSSSIGPSYSVTKIGFPGNSVDLTIVNLGSIDLGACYFDGVRDDSYLIECVQGGDIGSARFRITSGSGKDDVYGFTTTAWGTAYEFGRRGIKIGFTRSGSDIFETGMTWELDVSFGTKTAVATSSGSYSGTSDTTYIIEVVNGGRINSSNNPIISVRTSNGIDSSGLVEVTDFDLDLDVGNYGVKISFGSDDESIAGLYTGDQFLISCEADKPGAYKVLVLADDLPAAFLGTETTDVDLGVFIYTKQDVVLYLDEYTIADDVVSVDSDLSRDIGILNGTTPVLCSIDYGDVYMTFRALRQSDANILNEISSISDIESTLGPISVDNPLAFGVYWALLNSNGQSVLYISVESDDISGYSKCLEVLEKYNTVYNIVPLTHNSTILGVVKQHVLSMSQPEVGRWRRAFFGINYRTEKPIIDLIDDEPALATITQDPDTGKYTVVTTSNASFISSGVQAGDILRYKYTGSRSSISYETKEIKEVLSETTLKLLDEAESVPVASKFEIWRNLSTTESISDFIGRKNSICGSSEYIIDVFAKRVADNDNSNIPLYYLAAAVAGRRSGIVPQQPLTGLDITGPTTIESFTSSQMNEIASNGVLIVTSQIGGYAYVRHGLTSNMSDVMTREESIRSNIDTISYYFLNLLEPFRGQMLMTPDALEALRTTIFNVISNLKSEQTSVYLGKLLVDGEIVTLAPHEVIKDRLVIRLRLTLAVVANVIDLTLYI